MAKSSIIVEPLINNTRGPVAASLATIRHQIITKSWLHIIFVLQIWLHLNSDLGHHNKFFLYNLMQIQKLKFGLHLILANFFKLPKLPKLDKHQNLMFNSI